jgi:hypothetical protein
MKVARFDCCLMLRSSPVYLARLLALSESAWIVMVLNRTQKHGVSSSTAQLEIVIEQLPLGFCA